MGSISHHITLLVIHSLGGGHTNTHTRIQTFTDRSNSKKPGAPGFKKLKLAIATIYSHADYIHMVQGMT